MTDDTLKIDRPVTGDVNLGYPKTVVPQLSPAEFLAEIDRVTAVPGVSGLIWEQYTPYFNDGDPCEFSINEARVLLTEDGEVDHYRDYESGWSTWDLYSHAGDYVYPNYDGSNFDEVSWKTLPGGVSGRVVYELLTSLKVGAWENVARANFGDHAQVTATAEGFNIEYYEHD